MQRRARSPSVHSPQPRGHGKRRPRDERAEASHLGMSRAPGRAPLLRGAHRAGGEALRRQRRTPPSSETPEAARCSARERNRRFGFRPRRVEGSHAVDEPIAAELHRHWSDDEMVGVVALFGYLNRWNDSMATTLEAPAVDAGTDASGRSRLAPRANTQDSSGHAGAPAVERCSVPASVRGVRGTRVPVEVLTHMRHEGGLIPLSTAIGLSCLSLFRFSFLYSPQSFGETGSSGDPWVGRSDPFFGQSAHDCCAEPSTLMSSAKMPSGAACFSW